MAPLTWKNVDEPDLTRASDILARAASGLQEGFGGLGENFGNMHDIQRRNRSAAALGQIAGITGGGNVDAILSQVQAGIDPMYRTDELNAAIANSRGVGLGYDQTRANTNSVNSETNRLDTNFNRTIAREDALAALTPELARMQQEAYGVGDGSSVPTGEMASYVREGLIARGMPAHIVEGFLMNFQDESGFDTSAVGDNGNAFGLAQWNGPRMRALQAYAASVGGRPSDPDIQMDFLMNELQTNESGAWGIIQQATDARTAAAAVLNHFERPAEEHRVRREAAYLGSSGNYVPDIASLLGENTVLRPEDVMGLIDNLYGDRRTALANQNADQSAADQELMAAETARGERIIQEANDWAFQNRNNFGPGSEGMQAQMDAIMRDDSLSQEMSAARQAAVLKLYTENESYFAVPADQRLESPIDQIVTETLAHMDQAQTNDPLLNAVRNAGMLPGQTAADMNAVGEVEDGEGEGATMAASPQSPEAQIRAMRERLGQVWNQEEETWEGSGMSQNDGELLALVDQMDRELKGGVDRNTLVALLEFSRRPVMGYFGSPTGEIAVNEEVFRQQATKLAEPGQLAIMREAVRQEQLQRDEVAALQTEYDDAYGQQQYWMDRSNEEGDLAYQRAMGEARRQQVIEAELRGIYDRTAPDIPKDVEDSNGPESEERSDPFGLDAASRIDTILENAVDPRTPTRSGAVVDPEASSFAQDRARNQQIADVRSALVEIDNKLNGLGAGGLATALNRMTDDFVSQREFASREIERAVAERAQEFFRSRSGMMLLASDPEALAQALEDPLDFYIENMRLGLDPRMSDEEVDESGNFGSTPVGALPRETRPAASAMDRGDLVPRN